MSSARSTVGLPQRGFTLIEVMVVVVIIGLLAAFVVPNLIGNVDRAAVTRAKGDIRIIETALSLYRLDNFRYPSTEQGLQALVINPGEAAAQNWKPYLNSVPSDPWNSPYQYLYPGQPRDGQQREFDVFSYGADGQEGGDDIDAEIGNWNLD
ncbi:MAG: type II secretion system major pseudopilin GspG [Gammaproteobacteria bacterium]